MKKKTLKSLAIIIKKNEMQKINHPQHIKQHKMNYFFILK